MGFNPISKEKIRTQVERDTVVRQGDSAVSKPQREASEETYLAC